VPLLVAAAGIGLLWSLGARRERLPFPLALALFVLSYLGLGISLYPNIVPQGVTYHQAAAPDSSLAFLLAGAGPLLVIILAYTAFAYWVFRGKVDRNGGGYG
jgi:cytochrome d ubiquinol oxidase subunit II